MIEKYGPNVMKQLHFNNGATTLAKATIAAGVAIVMGGVAEAADVQKCKILTDAWKEVSIACAKNGITP